MNQLRLGYYVSLKYEFAKIFLSLKIKIVVMNMKSGGYPLRIFWKIIYKLDNIIHSKAKVTLIKVNTLKFYSNAKNSKNKIQFIED